MKLIIETTEIPGNYIDVSNMFDENLFQYLLPQFPPSKIEIFEGSKKGNIVQLQIGPLRWQSIITHDEINESEAFFIDVGKILPFPLRYWKHKHIVRKVDETSCSIIDDMEFSSGIKMIDYLIYPFMKSMFSKRIKQYRAYFSE